MNGTHLGNVLHEIVMQEISQEVDLWPAISMRLEAQHHHHRQIGLWQRVFRKLVSHFPCWRMKQRDTDERRQTMLVKLKQTFFGRTDAKRPLFRLSLPVALLLLVMIFAAVPVVAQTLLKYIVPSEVSQLPEATHVSTSLTSSIPQMIPFAQIQEQVGFEVASPLYLPIGCQLLEQFAEANVRVHLGYSCVTITEQAGRYETHPAVGPDSVHNVTVNGRPALYITGTWVKVEGRDKTPRWANDFGEQLIFERNNLIVHLETVQGLGQEELIKIAASMQ